MASLRKNVDRILAARGIDELELGRRIDKSKAELVEWLDDPPKRREGVVKKIAEALVVPDFFLFSDELTPERTIADFRLSTPRPRGYQRSTLKAIEFARQVQNDETIEEQFSIKRSLQSVLLNYKTPVRSAAALREIIGLTDEAQIEFENPRLLYAHVRRKIEEFETFVFQMGFPTEDGVGFAIANPRAFNSIVVNTRSQIPARRLFTLAHEVYHCKLNATGISDPDVVKNDVERQCNAFAAHFLAPPSLVKLAAKTTIKAPRFNVGELKKFAALVNLSMATSLFRLVDVGIYEGSAVGAWTTFLKQQGSPDFQTGGGGKRTDEWKFKLGKYGTRFAEVYGKAIEKDRLDEYEFFRVSGIKPKYQPAYLKNAPKASLQDAEDEADD